MAYNEDVEPLQNPDLPDCTATGKITDIKDMETPSKELGASASHLGFDLEEDRDLLA